MAKTLLWAGFCCGKRQMMRRLLSVLLVLTLALALSFSPAAVGYVDSVNAASDDEWKAALSGAGNWILARTPAPQNGYVGGEWAVLALARSGVPVPEGYYAGYVARMDDMVKAASSAQLDPTKSTENERLILALSALGVDATSVGGKDIVTPLTQDFAWLTKQGINGGIFALIALDTKPYLADNSAARSQIISYIIGKVEADFGWSLDGTGMMKADITGMALQALAPYYRGERMVPSPAQSEIKGVVDKALIWLSSNQTADGGIAGSSESCAQAIAALCALGYDPGSDLRFVMDDGKSLIDGLLSYYDAASGGFRHVAGGSVDGMATEQAAYALAAYSRFKNGLTRLYDMSDAFVAPAVTEEERKEEAEKLEEEKTYDVTFDANGGQWGSEETKEVPQREGENYALPGSPKRAKYTFTGWYTTEKSGGAEVTKTTVVQEKEEHTLWARWAVTKKTITYNANGGKLAASGKKGKSVKTVKKAATYGKKYALPKTPKRTGYKFKGWYTKKKGGDKVTKVTKVLFASGKQTLYARWGKK